MNTRPLLPAIAQQQLLFPDASIVAAPAQGIQILPAPALDLEPHQSWPYPGLTPVDCARAQLSRSKAYTDVIAAVIKRHGGQMTDAEVKAAIPTDWLNLLGRWAHASLSPRQGEDLGIEVKYVGHEGSGGFHFTYKAQG